MNREQELETQVASQERTISALREVMFGAADVANDADGDTENGLRQRLSLIAKHLYTALEKPEEPEPPTLRLV
mgnify:CR=1 FL=1